MDLFWIILLVAIYLAPSIADQILNGNIRAHVFIVNLTLGWTIIAWVYVFIWVFNERKRRRQYQHNFY